jgi:tetratricopeptide (TPR) repeat protein
MQGRFAEGREALGRARTVLENLGAPLHIAGHAFLSGPLELLAGDARAAERELRPAVDTFQRLGEKARLCSLAAFLSEALYQQDEFEEAEAYAELAEQSASREDLNPHAFSRSIRAKILARHGRFKDAEQLAREAVAIIRRGDEINHEAQVLLDLGEVLRLAGRPEDASGAVEEALALYTRKGNVVAAQRAQRLLTELASEPVAERD